MIEVSNQPERTAVQDLLDQHIEVTGVNLTKMVQAAYRLSWPRELAAVGMAMPSDMHLGEMRANRFINLDSLRAPEMRWQIVCSIDYVDSLNLKFLVRSWNGRLFIKNYWYDHEMHQLHSLLHAVGMPWLQSQAVESPHKEH